MMLTKASPPCGKAASHVSLEPSPGELRMPFANMNSVRLHYQVLGNRGPWVALVSGARRGMAEVRGLGTLVADAGFQILLHDRRNTGQSSLSLDGEGSKF